MVNNVEDGAESVEVSGWHFHPNETVEKLKKSQKIIVGNSDGIYATRTDSAHIAIFDRAAKGSIVAFESNTTNTYYLGPIALIEVLSPYPTKSFHVECALDPSIKTQMNHRIVPFRFSGWNL